MATRFEKKGIKLRQSKFSYLLSQQSDTSVRPVLGPISWKSAQLFTPHTSPRPHPTTSSDVQSTRVSKIICFFYDMSLFWKLLWAAGWSVQMWVDRIAMREQSESWIGCVAALMSNNLNAYSLMPNANTRTGIAQPARVTATVSRLVVHAHFLASTKSAKCTVGVRGTRSWREQ